MNVIHNDKLVPRFLWRTMGLSDFRRRMRAGLRGEDHSALFLLALLWTVLLGILPIVAAMIVGVAQGKNSENFISTAPGYPAFTTLSPGLIVPAVLLAAVFARTFTWPLKGPGIVHRGELLWMALLGMNVAVVAVTLDRALIPVWAGRFAVGAALIFLAVALLASVRMLLGWLRLVPRSWREEPTKIKRKRTS